MNPGPDEELIARTTMSKLLHVEVRQHDDNSKPSMVDFAFTMPDGRTGAAEMTTITDPADRKWAALANQEFVVSGSSWAWMVRRNGTQVLLRDLREHLPYLALLAERDDEPELRNLLETGLGHPHPALEWLAKSKVDIRGLRSTARPGTVYLEPDSAWSFAPESLDAALEWIEKELEGPRFDGEFKKLAETGAAEQHLVLRIDVGAAVPFEHWSALVDSQMALPGRDLKLRGRHLTGLWLLPDFGTSVVYWSSASGWHRASA